MSTADLHRAYMRLRDKAFSLWMAPSFAEFGARSVLQRPCRSYGEGHIAIGNDVFIGTTSWLQAEPVDTTGGPVIIIGDRTIASGMLIVSAVEKVEIRPAVLFARNVYIADHRHRSSAAGAVRDQGIEGVAAVRIGEGAWLGQNVVVLPGTTIGSGAVIGANSVVGGDIPARALAVGSPARIVRHFDGPGD